MVSASEFVDGTDVQWARLARVLFGATVGAWFTGLASVVLGLSDVPLAALEWLGGFLGQLVEYLVGAPVQMVEGSFAGAAGFLEGTGLLGFVLAISIVLLTLYVVVRVVRLA